MISTCCLIDRLFVGFPVVMVALSLSIAAGKDGIESFISEK